MSNSTGYQTAGWAKYQQFSRISLWLRIGCKSSGIHCRYCLLGLSPAAERFPGHCQCLGAHLHRSGKEGCDLSAWRSYSVREALRKQRDSDHQLGEYLEPDFPVKPKRELEKVESIQSMDSTLFTVDRNKSENPKADPTWSFSCMKCPFSMQPSWWFTFLLFIFNIEHGFCCSMRATEKGGYPPLGVPVVSADKSMKCSIQSVLLFPFELVHWFNPWFLSWVC